MTFKTHLDEAAFRREISRWAKPGRTPYYPTHIICREDELIGGVNGNRFWLKKIRPQLVIGSQRVFYGKITSADDGVIVKGRFRYDLMTRLTTWAFFLIILGIYIALEYSQPVDTVISSGALLSYFYFPLSCLVLSPYVIFCSILKRKSS